MRFQVPAFCHPLHLGNDDQSPAHFSGINILLGVFDCLRTDLRDAAAPGKPPGPGLMLSVTGFKPQRVPVQRWLDSSGEKAL